ncbi:MAG TPA: hypothetical protein VMZ90_03700, partial [Vicinamibacterales bacterium]|nr:hypothetical protein [Vicinamibacterales bacterium]
MTRGSAASVFGRTAGLAAITVVQTYWFLQPGPLAFKGLIALIVVISLSRPSGGLLIFAGLAPLSTAIATLCGANALGGQFLEQIALGVGAGVILHGIREQGRTRTGAPALFMAAVAIAS